MRCECGGYLSLKQVQTGQRVSKIQFNYDEEGNITGIAKEEHEPVKYVVCKRCNREVELR
jgi:hypothetical protein